MSIESWNGPGKLDFSRLVGGKLYLKNVEFWLEQAREDPTFNIELLQEWKSILEAHIKHTGLRFDAAKLFGALCGEWLKSGDSSAMIQDTAGDDNTPADIGPADSEEDVNMEKKEVLDEREKLESLIFEECPLDVNALSQYLTHLFSKEEPKVALDPSTTQGILSL